MEKISEKDLGKVIKKYFFLNTILIELEGIIKGHISIIKAVCKYNDREGNLYIFDVLNNLTIDIASQYEILFDKEKRKLKIRLDNGQNVILTVINKKGTL